MKGVFNRHAGLAELVEFSQDWARKHVLDLNLASTFRVKEKEELSDGGDDIEWIKRLSKLFELRERWHELEDVILQVLLFQVAVATRVVKRDLDACLEQVDFPDDVVEEGDDFDATKLVTFKLQESARAKELAALRR